MKRKIKKVETEFDRLLDNIDSKENEQLYDIENLLDPEYSKLKSLMPSRDTLIP